MPLFKLDLTGVSGKNIIVSGLQMRNWDVVKW